MTEARLTTDWRIARSVAIRLVLEHGANYGVTQKQIFEMADEIAEYIVKGRMV